jgi:hypothetical protein
VLLRCPQCAVVETYGPSRVLGELVVCVQCHTPFAWQDALPAQAETAQKNGGPNPEVEKESSP